jgi:hypothetical protein
MTPRNFQRIEFAGHIITERQDERKRSSAAFANPADRHIPTSMDIGDYAGVQCMNTVNQCATFQGAAEQ